ncbi:unnamed protein product [Mytilus edulis]|uniref:B box-type domain-containing protein n=1 Tax=Mytilus edulis TaxID=6550 RepID=A0A8S3T665_MYTED|nr:unnamed protein product [Mytilus edulis]
MHFGDIKCTEHSKEICCLYCKVCDKLICMQCVTKTHKSHDFEEISSGYSIRKENLRNHAIKLKEQEETLTNDIEKLNKMKEEDKLQYGQVKKEITTHEKSVKDEVEQYSNSLTDELDRKWGSHQTAIDREIDQVNEIKIKIQEKVKKSEDVMNIEGVTEFFQKTEEIETSFKEDVKITPLEKDNIPSFISGKQYQISDFGKLKAKNEMSEMDEENESGMKIKLNMGNEYSTDLINILRVTHSSDGSIWLYSPLDDDHNTGSLRKVELIENTLHEISKYELIAHDMTVTPSNDILLSTNDVKIKRIGNKTGQLMNTKYTAGSLVPSAICMKGNTILFSAVNRDYPVHGRRVVIRMNRNGKQERLHEYWGNGEPIFSFPLSLACSNDKENIFVVDGLSGHRESAFRIIFFLGTETIEIYKGHSSVNSFDQQFCPTDIQAAPSNNIIVNDFSTNTLQILNPSGQLSAYVSLNEMGIQNSYSLCCTSKQLFIGCITDEENECEQNQEQIMAKLYELNIEGCSHLV